MSNLVARFTLGSATDAELDLQLLEGIALPSLPNTRDHSAVVLGKHGQYDFGAKLRPLTIILPCIILNSTSQASLQTKVRALANHLTDDSGDPRDIELSLSWDSGKFWTVRYSGSLPVRRRPKWAELDLILLASDPFAHSIEIETIATITTDPQTVIVTNSGNINTPGIIQMVNNTGSTIAGFTLTRVATP